MTIERRTSKFKITQGLKFYQRMSWTCYLDKSSYYFVTCIYVLCAGLDCSNLKTYKKIIIVCFSFVTDELMC